MSRRTHKKRLQDSRPCLSPIHLFDTYPTRTNFQRKRRHAMGLRELNVDLTKDHVALWDSTKKFMKEVWRPAAIELDKLPNPEDVIAEGSVLWDVLRQSFELGYHSMFFPEEFGGMNMDPLSVGPGRRVAGMGRTGPGSQPGRVHHALPVEHALAPRGDARAHEEVLRRHQGRDDRVLGHHRAGPWLGLDPLRRGRAPRPERGPPGAGRPGRGPLRGQRTRRLRG